MKKGIYDEIGDLLSDLRNDIEGTLLDEVLDEVKDIELRYIYEDVLSTYSPKVYTRRGQCGIDDPDNIIGQVDNMELVVENITEFAPGYGTVNHGVGLAELINDGDRQNGYFYDYPGEFNQPRPFLDHTVEEVETTERIDDALAKDLKKKGYDID